MEAEAEAARYETTPRVKTCFCISKIQPFTNMLNLCFRIAAEEQERRDYELAMRLAQVSVMLSSTYGLVCMIFVFKG